MLRVISNPNNKSKPTTTAEHSLSSLNHTANDMILIPSERGQGSFFLIQKGRTIDPDGLTSAKKLINIVTCYHVISLFFHLIAIFSLHCQLFLLISGSTKYPTKKITYRCKILILPEQGWFGQPKYNTPAKKSFYVLSTSAFIFFILYVKPIRSLLIQRTPAGSSFRLFA